MNQPRGVIYIDGANAMGKSFLADSIKQRYPGAKVVHCTYRFGKKMWYYHLAALRHCLRHAETGLAILDRNWISEEIYGHYFRNGTNIPHQGRIVQKLFLQHAAVGVLCIGSATEAKKRVDEHRTENYHSPQFVTKPEQIANRYWDLYYGKAQVDWTPKNTYADDLMKVGGLRSRYDWTKYEISVEGKNIDEFIDNVMEMLKFQRETQYQEALEFGCRNFGGHLRTGKWLFVGDVVNFPDYKKCWPFMIHANSTLFMANAMHILGCKEEEFMWTNAYPPQEFHVQKILALKPEVKVIALGGNAHKRLEHFSIPHRTIPHPSYGRRFMGPERWREELQKALLA